MRPGWLIRRKARLEPRIPWLWLNPLSPWVTLVMQNTCLVCWRNDQLTQSASLSSLRSPLTFGWIKSLIPTRSPANQSKVNLRAVIGKIAATSPTSWGSGKFSGQWDTKWEWRGNLPFWKQNYHCTHKARWTSGGGLNLVFPSHSLLSSHHFPLLLSQAWAGSSVFVFPKYRPFMYHRAQDP